MQWGVHYVSSITSIWWVSGCVVKESPLCLPVFQYLWATTLSFAYRWCMKTLQCMIWYEDVAVYDLIVILRLIERLVVISIASGSCVHGWNWVCTWRMVAESVSEVQSHDVCLVRDWYAPRGELGKMVFVVHLEKLSQSERTAYVTNQPIRTQTTGHLIASGGWIRYQSERDADSSIHRCWSEVHFGTVRIAVTTGMAPSTILWDIYYIT